METEAKKARPKRKLGMLGCAGIIAVGVVAAGLFSNAVPEDPQAKAKQEAETAENKRKGFHCLSSWDGSHTGVVESVKRSLRNPDSFDHADTRIIPVNARGEHELVMQYRAQNGFGGMNLAGVTARIRNSDCGVIAVTAIE